MDHQALVAILREGERALIDLGAVLAIYLGYQLFLRMPSRERGEGKLELPGGVSIFVTRVGPGVFFSLFGAAILSLSLIHGVSLDTSNSIAAGPAAAGATAAAANQAATSTHYAGTTETAPAADLLLTEAERESVLLAIRNLNRAPAALRVDLPAGERLDIEQAIAIAKRRLLQSVWKADDWGDPGAFQQWLDQGAADPPPAAIGKAVAIYRGGQETAPP